MYIRYNCSYIYGIPIEHVANEVDTEVTKHVHYNIIILLYNNYYYLRGSDPVHIIINI